MVERLVAPLRTRLGVLIMAMVNLITAAVVLGWAWHTWTDRASGEAARAAWLTKPLMAPTEITVQLGATMNETWVIEEPIHDGPRILSPDVQPGEWVFQLRHRGDLICRQPASGGNKADYHPDAVRRLRMPWPQYTGDDGSCFDLLRPCETYRVRVLRKMAQDGVVRYLDPVEGELDVPCDWTRP